MLAIDILSHYYFDQGMSFGGFLMVSSALLFFLLFNRILWKKPIYYLPKDDLSLGNYTFNFNHDFADINSSLPSKKLSFVGRLFLWLMVIIFIVTPFYRLVLAFKSHSWWGWY